MEWKCPEDSKQYKTLVEKDRIYQFLLGLNKNLDEVRGRILSTKPLPSIPEASAEVRREESRRRIMLSGENDSIAMKDPHWQPKEPKRKTRDGVITAEKQGRQGRLAGYSTGSPLTRSWGTRRIRPMLQSVKKVNPKENPKQNLTAIFSAKNRWKWYKNWCNRPSKIRVLILPLLHLLKKVISQLSFMSAAIKQAPGLLILEPQTIWQEISMSLANIPPVMMTLLFA